MTPIRNGLLFLAFAGSNAVADLALCEIEIEDVIAGTTYTIKQEFQFDSATDILAHRKHFDLPGTDFGCTLAFFDFEIGTMISCEYKVDGGHTFFQSDRSGLQEDSARNHLAFRFQDDFFVIKSACHPGT